MSGYLLVSSVVTALLIPAEAFEPGGEANGRALAYLAHEFLGDGFGTVYDLSTILSLWFAGASAMAGLLTIVPRYLPRYGMAPEWTRATRPLVLVFTAVAFAVTVLFRADVTAQGGAYATGVLVLITSASVAVTLAARRAGQRAATIGFGLIALAFLYTTAVNAVERPDGVKIAACFIGAVVVTSIVSRVLRAQGASIPNAIAAVLLHVRDVTGTRPHAYFDWSEYPPVVAAIRYLLFGEGDVAPVTREVLRHAEHDSARRPAVHVG